MQIETALASATAAAAQDNGSDSDGDAAELLIANVHKELTGAQASLSADKAASLVLEKILRVSASFVCDPCAAPSNIPAHFCV